MGSRAGFTGQSCCRKREERTGVIRSDALQVWVDGQKAAATGGLACPSPQASPKGRGSQKLRLPLALFAVVVVAGCGGQPLGKVSGKVTLDEQPLTAGVVVLESADVSVSVNAPLDAEGKFEVRTYDKQGIPPGSYRIAVRPGGSGSGDTPLVGAADPAAKSASAIPAKYHDVKTSGLSAEVKEGANELLELRLHTE